MFDLISTGKYVNSMISVKHFPETCVDFCFLKILHYFESKYIVVYRSKYLVNITEVGDTDNA